MGGKNGRSIESEPLMNANEKNAESRLGYLNLLTAASGATALTQISVPSS